MSSFLRIATILTGLTTSLGAFGVDWPSWRGPSRNGITTDPIQLQWPADGPAKVWSARVDTGFSSMVISEGRLFTMGYSDGKDIVHAFDAVSGKSLWTHSYEEELANKMYEGGPNSTPLVANGTVYTTSKTGHIHAFEASTGKVLWDCSLKKMIGAKLSAWGVSGAPFLLGDKLIVAYGPHGIALEPGTGKILWDSGKSEDSTYAAPVVGTFAGKETLLFIMSKALIGVDPASGKKLWENEFGQGFRTHCSDPIISGQRIFISSGDDGGELLDLSAGQPKRIWKNKNLSTFTGTAVLIGGYLYGHETAAYKKPQQEFRCVELASGDLKWSLGGFGQGSVIASGGHLLVLSDAGELALLKATPEKAEIIAKAQVIGGKTWTAPALANGFLYVRNAKGDLVCLNLKI